MLPIWQIYKKIRRKKIKMAYKVDTGLKRKIFVAERIVKLQKQQIKLLKEQIKLEKELRR